MKHQRNHKQEHEPWQIQTTHKQQQQKKVVVSTVRDNRDSEVSHPPSVWCLSLMRGLETQRDTWHRGRALPHNTDFLHLYKEWIQGEIHRDTHSMEDMPCLTIQTSNTCAMSGSRAGDTERYTAWRTCPASQYRLLTPVHGVDLDLEEDLEVTEAYGCGSLTLLQHLQWRIYIRKNSGARPVYGLKFCFWENFILTLSYLGLRPIVSLTWEPRVPSLP